MAEHKITIEQCLKTVKELNIGIEQSEELLNHKANWLYMLNKLNFWEDMPILIEIVKYEAEKKANNILQNQK